MIKLESVHSRTLAWRARRGPSSVPRNTKAASIQTKKSSPFQVQLPMTSLLLSGDLFQYHHLRFTPSVVPFLSLRTTKLEPSSQVSDVKVHYDSSNCNFKKIYLCVTVCMNMCVCGGQKRACVSSPIALIIPLKRGLSLKLGFMFSWLG